MDQISIPVVAVADYTPHYDIQNSPRRREIDKWRLIAKPAYTDPNLKIWCLAGWTVLEADGSQPPARWTVTSPIVSCDHRVVTTASGSKYFLLEQATSGEVVLDLDPNCPQIPDEYLNKWIDGKNWVTI